MHERMLLQAIENSSVIYECVLEVELSKSILFFFVNKTIKSQVVYLVSSIESAYFLGNLKNFFPSL